MAQAEQCRVLLIRDYLIEITVPLICGYCGIPLTKETATLDHINPRADGHETTIWNGVLACKSCNSRKGNKYWAPKHRPPVTAQSFRNFASRMKRTTPEKYWPWKYKETRKYEEQTGRRIS